MSEIKPKKASVKATQGLPKSYLSYSVRGDIRKNIWPAKDALLLGSPPQATDLGVLFTGSKLSIIQFTIFTSVDVVPFGFSASGTRISWAFSVSDFASNWS